MLRPHGDAVPGEDTRALGLPDDHREGGPELWAYQMTIVKAAHAYEGSNWVLYDRQFRREMLAGKDLNWSVPDARLYNEAFTGRAKSITRYSHCLSEDHTAAMCQFNPNPPIVGGLQDPRQFFTPTALPAHLQGSGFGVTCRNYNSERCTSHAAAFRIPAPSARASTLQPDAPRAQRAAAGSQWARVGDEAGRPWGTHTGHTCS